MKKLLLLLIILTLSFSTFACGNSSSDKDPSSELSSEGSTLDQNVKNEKPTPLTNEELISLISPDSQLLKSVSEETVKHLLVPYKGLIKKPGNLQSIDFNDSYISINLEYPGGTYASLQDLQNEYGGSLENMENIGDYISVDYDSFKFEISIDESNSDDTYQYISYDISNNSFDAYESILNSLPYDGIFPDELFDYINSKSYPLIYKVSYSDPIIWVGGHTIFFNSDISEDELQLISDMFISALKSDGYVEGTIDYVDSPVLVKQVNIDGQEVVYYVEYGSIVENNWISIQTE